MRKMVSTNGTELYVKEHIITRNLWEYYIVDDEPSDHEINYDMIQLAYVMGFENELGSVYMPEIEPYILSRTKDLSNIMPASGFNWVD